MIDSGACWNQNLSLGKFAYNNSYHFNIQMVLFEAIYGRRCQSLIGWFDSVSKDDLEVDFPREEMERVCLIQSRLVATYSQHKSYVDRRIWPLEFMVCDHVWLKVSPKKGVMRFGKRRKLSLLFIDPF